MQSWAQKALCFQFMLLLHTQLPPRGMFGLLFSDRGRREGERQLVQLGTAPELLKGMSQLCHLHVNSLPLLFLSHQMLPVLGPGPCSWPMFFAHTALQLAV